MTIIYSLTEYIQDRRSLGEQGALPPPCPNFLTTKFFIIIKDNEKKLKNLSFKNYDSVSLAQKV